MPARELSDAIDTGNDAPRNQYFSPIPTRLRAFGPKSDGQTISVYRGTIYPLVAYTDIAGREGVESP